MGVMGDHQEVVVGAEEVLQGVVEGVEVVLQGVVEGVVGVEPQVEEVGNECLSSFLYCLLVALEWQQWQLLLL